MYRNKNCMAERKSFLKFSQTAVLRTLPQKSAFKCEWEYEICLVQRHSYCFLHHWKKKFEFEFSCGNSNQIVYALLRNTKYNEYSNKNIKLKFLPLFIQEMKFSRTKVHGLCINFWNKLKKTVKVRFQFFYRFTTNTRKFGSWYESQC